MKIHQSPPPTQHDTTPLYALNHYRQNSAHSSREVKRHVTVIYRHKRQLQLQLLALRPRPRTLICHQTTIRSPSLPFNGLCTRNPCTVITWITIRLPTPMGWKAEMAWLIDP